MIQELDTGLDWTGWGGNSSEAIEEVSQKISVLKSINDCPVENKSFVWYDTDDWPEQKLKFKLKKVSYPHHICCELETPIFKESSQMLGLNFAYSFVNKSFNSFKIFMSDKVTDSFFTFHKTKMLGEKIMIKGDINGVVSYKIEIKEDIHLAENPNYPCIEYNIEGDYHECLENEIVSNWYKNINCTPHWLTDNKDLWCKGKMKFKSSKDITEYWKYTDKVLLSDADPGACLTPCTSKKYLSTEIGLKESEDDEKGVALFIDKEVEITKSELQIGFRTLITRFGGIIGVSKNLLWIVIFGITSIGFLINKMSKKTDPEVEEKNEKDTMI